MAEETKKKSQGAGGGGGKKLLSEKQRGTQDDVEVIKLILDDNPALRQRVLDKIKALRKMSKL